MPSKLKEITCILCGSKKLTRNHRNKYCSPECFQRDCRDEITNFAKESMQKRVEKLAGKHDKLIASGWINPLKGRPTGRRPEQLQKWREENPEKAAELSIRNLPKNCSGSANGNWRGGLARIRDLWRNKNGNQLHRFRLQILERDQNTCRDCQSQEQLELHHIIPLAMLHEAAFIPMNAIILCKSCHKKTDSYCGRFVRTSSQFEPAYTYSATIIITIPHRWQEYPTCGNYAETENGILIVFVSKMRDERSEIAIGVHEYLEAKMCKTARIPFSEITEFDLLFEEERSRGLHLIEDEPGDDPRSPYLDAHQAATVVEKEVCNQLGLAWSDHSDNVNALFANA